MTALVDAESPAGSEPLVTHGALMQLLSCVNALVSPERPQLSEALVARVAPVLPHSIVETHVSLETFLFEALAAS